MSRCSSMVFNVKGLVGFVDEGRTFFTPHTLMISGAWPPPAPSLPRKVIENSKTEPKSHPMFNSDGPQDMSIQYDEYEHIRMYRSEYPIMGKTKV